MPSRLFDEIVLPHLDAAFNYARWLTRHDAEAEDVVQDACVRALRFFPSLRDDDARAWLLAIVRNTWYSRVSRRTGPAQALPLASARGDPPDDGLDPEALLLQQRDRRAGARGARAAARRFSRGDRAARDRRDVLQGNRRGRARADRHRDVASGTRARSAVGGVASVAAPMERVP